MTIAEGFKLFGTALGCEFTDEQSIAEVLSAISKKFGGASAQTIADAAAEIAKVSDQIISGDLTIIPRTFTENGTYEPSEDGANAYGQVIVEVPTPRLETVTVTPSTSAQSISPSENYDAISNISVLAVDRHIDGHIRPENIKAGVTILGVEGTYTGG